MRQVREASNFAFALSATRRSASCALLEQREPSLFQRHDYVRVPKLARLGNRCVNLAQPLRRLADRKRLLVRKHRCFAASATTSTARVV